MNQKEIEEGISPATKRNKKTIINIFIKKHFNKYLKNNNKPKIKKRINPATKRNEEKAIIDKYMEKDFKKDLKKK
jgi:hypothetical protein